MKNISSILAVFISVFFFGQENFTMNYQCYKVIKDGIWGRPIRTNLKVDFEIDSHKDLVFNDHEGVRIFKVTAKTFAGQDARGYKFLVIKTRSHRTTYYFQYFENRNLRLNDRKKNVSYEYGCINRSEEHVAVTEKQVLNTE